MGRHFGDLAVIRGIIYYRLSPYEQKPLAGAIMYGAPNMVYRVTSNIVYWLPPMVIGVLTYKYVEESYRASKRKNLKDYENEVDPSPKLKPCKPKDKKPAEKE